MNILDFNEYDLFYIGSGSEDNQLLVLNDLLKYKDNLNHISSTYKREEFLKIIYANLTYQKLDRKSLFPKNRGYNGIKLLDKLNLWSYFGKDTRLANIRGVGSYLNCFLKSKLDPLEAFSVDCYFYLKNGKIVQDSKDFIVKNTIYSSKRDKKGFFD